MRGQKRTKNQKRRDAAWLRRRYKIAAIYAEYEGCGHSWRWLQERLKEVK
jgi:hypothetical protein